MKWLLSAILSAFRSLSLTKRFVLLVAGLIILTVFSAQWFYARQSRTYLELRLKEKAAFINKFYSYVIAGLLMRKDDISLLQVVNTLEEDQEISSVIVVDQRDKIRYHIDPQKVGMTLEDPLVKNTLASGEYVETPFYNSGERALSLVSPLKVPGTGQLLGAVRIDLTYHTIESQMTSSGHRFWYITLGSIVTCAGIMLSFLGAWVLIPLQGLRASVQAINPAEPESHLPESGDEIGQVNAAINGLIVRFKSELSQQSTRVQTRAEQEKAWVRQIASSFFPQARLIIADKDNRVISDNQETRSKRQHLLDLIHDSNFATLLTTAFQKEGDVVTGPVNFQEQTYQAAILSVPMQQAMVVKTLIVLQPNNA